MIAEPAAVAADSVLHVTRDGDLVRVVVRFRPLGQPLPRRLARPRAVTATRDDANGTKLPVSEVSIGGELRDQLHVTVAGAATAQRFTLRFGGLLPGSDSVAVSLLEDAPFDPARPAPPPSLDTTRTLADYLAKDFRSFKRLMLDSISHTAPGSVEQHEADAVIALIEVLAFAADNLSYYQDAVATEAYLETARRRISVRRHARLLGYRLSEGCTPRVWLHVTPFEPFQLQRDEFRAFTELERRSDARTEAAGEPERKQVFQPLDDVWLHPTLEAMALWDDGRDDFVLVKGATSALLVRSRAESAPGPALERGTVLMFEQRTNVAGRLPAPLRHRQAVRLNADPVFLEHPSDPNANLVQIAWYEDDALTMDFPASTTEVNGNIVPADYGETKDEITLPPEAFSSATATLRVQLTNLTFAVPYAKDQPANDFTRLDPRHAVPSLLRLKATSFEDPKEWKATRELIGAERFERIFAVEVDQKDALLLRFGDGTNGERPDPSSRFTLRYRQGGGIDGHVGANTITKFAYTGDDAAGKIKGVTNPLPSAGGTFPEDIAQAKRWAPDRLREQRRCITDDDYVQVAQNVPGVKAYATRRWTGDRMTVDVYAHAHVDAPNRRARVRSALAAARMIGADVVVHAPRRAAVVAKLRVVHAPGTTWQDVQQNVTDSLRQALDKRNLTLGSPLFASWLIAAAKDVAAVTDVELVKFARFGGPDMRREGRIAIGPADVAVFVDERGMDANGLPLIEDGTP